MRGGEGVEGAPGPGGRRVDLVEALFEALGLDDVRDPAVALTSGARQRRLGAPADPDRRSRLLHGLGIDRHAVELREAPVERRGRVAPLRPHDVDDLGDPGAALRVRRARQLELLWILSADSSF